ATFKLQAIRPSYGDPFEIGGGAPSASDGGRIFYIREKHIHEVRPQSSWQMDCGCATAGALTLNMLRRPGLITTGDIGHALPMSDDKNFRRNVPPKRSLALAAAGIVPRRRGAVEWSSSDRNVPCSRTRRRITKTDGLREGGYKSTIHHQEARNSNGILRPSKVQGQITPPCLHLPLHLHLHSWHWRASSRPGGPPKKKTPRRLMRVLLVCCCSLTNQVASFQVFRTTKHRV
ncbi:hypothetical protein CMEL01_05233, partial [Colletotrichum melonis]